MQPQEVASEMVATDKGVGYRGIGFPDFGGVLRGSCEGSLII